MTPAEVVRNACSGGLSSEDGDPVEIDLRPGLTETETAAFASTLPCPLPPHVHDLLTLCRGFSGGAADFVDFTGADCSFEFEAVFPHGVPIAADGYGNFWVVDLWPDSRDWGPIYYACHDPPVILYQSRSLEHFLTELIKCNVPPFTSDVNDVHDVRSMQVWRNNPGVISYEQALGSGDSELDSFSRELGKSFELIDLRQALVGDGFAWGRYGPNTVVRRCGSLPIFAYEKKRTLLQRFFGGH